jgi:hypothetical protein
MARVPRYNGHREARSPPLAESYLNQGSSGAWRSQPGSQNTWGAGRAFFPCRAWILGYNLADKKPRAWGSGDVHPRRRRFRLAKLIASAKMRLCSSQLAGVSHPASDCIPPSEISIVAPVVTAFVFGHVPSCYLPKMCREPQSITRCNEYCSNAPLF